MYVWSSDFGRVPFRFLAFRGFLLVIVGRVGIWVGWFSAFTETEDKPHRIEWDSHSVLLNKPPALGHIILLPLWGAASMLRTG